MIKMYIILIFAACSCSILGTGMGCRRNDAFEMGAPIKSRGEADGKTPKSPEPLVEIVEPTSSETITVKPHDQVDCVVRLTLKAGEPPPTFVTVYLREKRKGRTVLLLALQPERKDGNSLLFRNVVKIPEMHGNCYLEAEATYLVTRPPGSYGNTPLNTPQKNNQPYEVHQFNSKRCSMMIE